MDYQKMRQLEELINYQIKFIDYMEELIKYDEKFVADNSPEGLPPLENIGVLKSHFITQRKACIGVLSLTARHLPRLKEEYDSNKAKEKEKAVQNLHAKSNSKSDIKPHPAPSHHAPKPNSEDNFISLFQGVI